MAVVDLLVLVVRLVQGEEPAHAEQHDRDQERVDIALRTEAERMLAGRSPARPLVPEQEQALVAAVGERVDGLGEHRSRSRQSPRDHLRDRHPEVREQRREHAGRTSLDG